VTCGEVNVLKIGLSYHNFHSYDIYYESFHAKLEELLEIIVACFNSEIASMSIETEIIMVGVYVSYYARLSICENRHQWVDLAAFCRVRNNTSTSVCELETASFDGVDVTFALQSKAFLDMICTNKPSIDLGVTEDWRNCMIRDIMIGSCVLILG
jgi:hypothetical protein